ncbi:MAG TPA: C39 family peptidase [Burkholderiales bacterium]|nr:C39 family peptidase [Burkholderiales bacterium]
MKSAVLLSVGLCSLAPALAGAGEVSLNGLPTTNAGAYTVRVASLKEAKFRRTIKQQYDFSCGSAALATLLAYHYGDPVTEAQVFQYMYERGDQAKIQREGFSLLDIKRYLEAHGYNADGFETSLDKLAKVGVPAIVLISDEGYHHFVVVKGILGGKVLVGDPSIGSRIVSRTEFARLWSNGIVFVITSQRDLATFNASAEWSSGIAPLGTAISRDALASTMIFLRGVNDF